MSDFLREFTDDFNMADMGRDGETQPPQQETTLQQDNLENLWNESAFNGDLNNNVEGMINEASIGSRGRQLEVGIWTKELDKRTKIEACSTPYS